MPLNDSLIKLMSERLSIFEIMGVRAAIALVLVCLLPATILTLWRLSFRAWIIASMRGFCLVSAMIFFFLPLATLSLAETTSIFFTAPLMISVLSVPLLGEKLGIYRILAVIMGLIGVLLIVQPGGDRFQLAYLMPLIAALSYAFYQVITRYMRNEVELLAMVAVQHVIYFVTGVIGLVAIAIIQPQVPAGEIWGFLLRPWSTPSIQDLLFLAIAALAVLNLSFVSTNVYSQVEATLIAPFEYIALPTSVVWGILIWNDWPVPTAWAGMALILSGGILMIYRENRRNTDIASAIPMRSAATNIVTLDDTQARVSYEPLPICF